MTLILGVDPGKRTGLGLIEVDDTKPYGRISLKTMRESLDVTCLDYLDLLQVADVIVVENFLIRPTKARTGSFDWDNMVAPRVIGAITSQAANLKKKIVLQEPSIKPVGYGWSNQHYVKGKKGQHIPDALAHAVYYAVRKLKAIPVKTS